MEIPAQHIPGASEQHSPKEAFDFNTFYTSMAPRAIARARQLGVHDPEGTWHDVALGIYRKDQNGTLNPHTINGLAYASLRNASIDEYRHNCVIHEEPTGELPEIQYDDETESMATFSALVDAIAANQTISAEQLEAFKLVYMKGLTVNEAAKLVGDPPGTIKSRLFIACRTLKADPTIASIAKESGYDKVTKQPVRKKGK